MSFKYCLSLKVFRLRSHAMWLRSRFFCACGGLPRPLRGGPSGRLPQRCARKKGAAGEPISPVAPLAPWRPAQLSFEVTGFFTPL